MNFDSLLDLKNILDCFVGANNVICLFNRTGLDRIGIRLKSNKILDKIINKIFYYYFYVSLTSDALNNFHFILKIFY
jgi:Flp pilus assembly CpaF family ATPase